MKIKKLHFAFLALAVFCGACDIPNKQKNAVWENYDVRTPIPYDSTVDSNRANQLRGYNPYALQPSVDNDAYYIAPAIKCGVSDFPACGE